MSAPAHAQATRTATAGTLDLTTSWTPATVPTGALATWTTGSATTGATGTAGVSFSGISIVTPGADVTISAGTVGLTLGADGIDMVNATRNLTISSSLTLGAAQTFNVATGRTLTVSGALAMGANPLTLSGDGNFTISGTATSSAGAGIVKNGSGTLSLLNSFPSTRSVGNITLNGGAYEQNHQNAINGGTITAADGTRLFLSAGFSNAGVVIAANANVTLQGTGGATRRWGAYNFNDGSVTTFETNGGAGTATFVTGTVTLNGTATLNTTTADFTLSAAIASGAGGIIKTGSGNLTFDSNAKAYTGGTTIRGGSLILNRNGGTLADTGAVSVEGGNLTVNFADTVGAVTVKSGAINGSAALTATSYAVESGSASAILAGTGVALTKTTSGTFTLSGVNTYTGATNINGGSLLVNGSTIAASAVTAQTTGRLGGTGTVNGAATVATNGFFGATSVTDNLTFANNLTINGTYAWEVSNNGATFDKALFTGTTLSLGGASAFDISAVGIDFSTGFWGTNQSWLVVDNTGAGSVSGTFASLTGLTGNSFGNFALVYGSGAGADVTLNWISSIPEPSTYAAIAGVAVLGLAAMRRRKVPSAA